MLSRPSLPRVGRPINRSSLTAHLHRTLKSPSEEGLRASANKALRWLGGAVAFYFAANLVLGGRKRVKHDLRKIQVRARGATPSSRLLTSTLFRVG